MSNCENGEKDLASGAERIFRDKDFPHE